MGYRSMEFDFQKENKDHEANSVDNITQDVSDINLSSLLSEPNGFQLERMVN